jgi:hypothetical protein
MRSLRYFLLNLLYLIKLLGGIFFLQLMFKNCQCVCELLKNKNNKNTNSYTTMSSKTRQLVAQVLKTPRSWLSACLCFTFSALFALALSLTKTHTDTKQRKTMASKQRARFTQ